MTRSTGPRSTRLLLCRAVLLGCGAVVIPGFLASCGSPPPVQAPADSDSEEAPAPTGPCDINHQLQAEAAASRAARKALGPVKLTRLDMQFKKRLLQPQQPGVAVSPPMYGWVVDFSVIVNSSDDPAASAATDRYIPTSGQVPAPPAPTLPTYEPTAMNRIPEAPLPSAQPAAPPMAPPDGALPADQRPIPGILTPIDPQHPGTIPQPASDPSDSTNRPQASTLNHTGGVISIFVTVDGTTIFL